MIALGSKSYAHRTDAERLPGLIEVQLASFRWFQDEGMRQLFDEISPVESFNGKFRDECLNEHWFVNLSDARGKIEKWRREYNTFRPHRSLGNLTPEEFAGKHKKEEFLAQALV